MTKPLVPVLCMFLTAGMTRAAETVPDFKLADANSGSNRKGGWVSPVDYRLQVSAYYFASAGCSICRAQLEYLETMLGQIRTANPELNVEIVGINRNSDAAANVLVTSQRKLPWLQDTTSDAVWAKWAVTYRDVRIVDPQGRLAAVYNLTEHNLSYPVNFATLKEMLLNAAKATDSDGDRLLDDWEMLHFGDLSADADGDPDKDDCNNLSEFAGGSDPRTSLSRPRAAVARVRKADGTFISLSLRQRAGAWFNYSLDASSALPAWSQTSGNLVPSLDIQTLFDGSGCSQVIYSIPASAAQGYFRVRANGP